MQAPQIITNTSKQGVQVWISQSALMSFCPSLTDGYMRRIRCGNKQGEINAWQNKQAHNTYYYELSSIPNKKPSMYASMLPTREELITMSQAPQQNNTTDIALQQVVAGFINVNYFKYLPYYNSQCTEQQATNLAKACAMLEWMVTTINETKTDLREMDLFKQACEVITMLEIKYLPDTAYRNLKYKVISIIESMAYGNALKDVIAKNVTLPRANNDYAALHREDKEVLGWIFDLRSTGANYTNAFIIRKIQAECNKLGKPVPSDRWIGEQLTEHNTQFLTASGRYGADGRYNNPYKASIPTANALFSGDCWEIDATRVNMIPHKNDGESKYLVIIAVRDVHSGNVIGRAYDVVENRWAYAQALHNAVESTGYLPYELRYDRFPGHNTEEVKELFKSLEMLGVKMTKTFKATGKQRLERWFGSMQHLALQESNFYYGEGIKSTRKTAHRSKEYMQSMAKIAKAQGWDFSKAIAETENKITSWLNTPYSQWSRKYKSIELSPVEMHEQSEKPNVVKVEEATRIFLFGLRKTLKIQNTGLVKTTINKEEFIYQITNYNIITQYKEVVCAYDVEDLSKVHLYAPGDSPMKEYLGTADEYTPVQTFGPNPEHGRLAKVRALYTEFDRQRTEELQQKKVANGGYVLGEDMAVIHPLTVSKSGQEAAESAITNQTFGFDDEGADLNVNSLNGL